MRNMVNASGAASIPATLILWDVDHTLIENGGISKETYALAYEMITGAPPKVRPATHGRTDFQIMRELLTTNSADASKFTDISHFLEVLTKAMEQKAPQLPGRGYALPGAREALVRLSAEKNVIQSALTGNIIGNARAKLGAFNLDGLIDLEVGGYGSDDVVRSNLVEIAREKVRQKYDAIFDKTSTIIIGDTPLDVLAAIDGGAQIIAVASGVHSEAELKAAGAEIVLDNLTDTSKLLDSIISVRASPRQ